MSDNPEDRFSDGFKMIIGDEVDYDSEAEFYKTKSTVGQKVQNSGAPPRRKISAKKRAALRRLGFK